MLILRYTGRSHAACRLTAAGSPGTGIHSARGMFGINTEATITVIVQLKPSATPRPTAGRPVERPGPTAVWMLNKPSELPIFEGGVLAPFDGGMPLKSKALPFLVSNYVNICEKHPKMKVSL